MKEITLTKSNFNEEVKNSTVPVVVDFWASWCGPCKMLAPILADLAENSDGKFKIGKVNVDEEMDLAMEYGIEVIPTLFYFKNGEIAKKSVGLMTKAEILAEIDKL